MSFAPKHDFQHFDVATAAARLELAKQATASQKVRRFAELLAISQELDGPDLARQEKHERWLIEKVSIRLRQLAVFTSLDTGR